MPHKENCYEITILHVRQPKYLFPAFLHQKKEEETDRQKCFTNVILALTFSYYKI